VPSFNIMKLIRCFYLQDIKDYELTHDDTLFDLIERAELFDYFSMCEILLLGNRGKTIDEVCALFDEFLRNKTYMDALDICRQELFKVEKNAVDVESDGLIDGHSYSLATELYTLFCNQLVSLGLDYSTFWNLTTSEMYSVAEALKQRHINEVNKNLYTAHATAAFVGAAFNGKLPKEPPQIRADAYNVNNGAGVQIDENGDIDCSDEELEALVNRLNSNVKAYNKRVNG